MKIGWDRAGIALVGAFIAVAAVLQLGRDRYFPWFMPPERHLLAIGDPVPDLQLPDLAGQRHSFGEFRGRPMLINLWASWCPQCTREMPRFQEVQRACAGRKLAVLTIGVDSIAALETEARRSRLGDLRIWVDDSGDRSQVEPLLGAQRAIPYTLLVDEDHRVVATFLGSFADTDQIERFTNDGLNTASGNLSPFGVCRS